jgi:O-methyltransferase
MVSEKLKSLVLRETPSFLSRLNYVAMIGSLSTWCRKNPCRVFDSRFDMCEFLVKPTEQIDFLEFGVGNGQSLKWWLNYNLNSKSRFRGYDVFTGLPEKWMRLPEKTFAQPLPQIEDDRCQLIVGMFQETVRQCPPFNEGKIIIHMDADLYSSTLYILTTIKPPPGSILVFDEFSAPMHEYKAFSEYVESHYARYNVIGRTVNYTQVAMEML